MNEIRDAICICLRQGKDPREVIDYLETSRVLIAESLVFKPTTDILMFAQAIKDSHFAP